MQTKKGTNWRNKLKKKTPYGISLVWVQQQCDTCKDTNHQVSYEFKTILVNNRIYLIYLRMLNNQTISQQHCF